MRVDGRIFTVISVRPDNNRRTLEIEAVYNSEIEV